MMTMVEVLCLLKAVLIVRLHYSYCQYLSVA